jgi:hypothetical protein
VVKNRDGWGAAYILAKPRTDHAAL